jgi:hypothetical protein
MTLDVSFWELGTSIVKENVTLYQVAFNTLGVFVLDNIGWCHIQELRGPNSNEREAVTQW